MLSKALALPRHHSIDYRYLMSNVLKQIRETRTDLLLLSFPQGG